MQPPQVKPDDPKFTCDVLLYDEESDRHVRITWMEALNASGVGKIVADNVAKAFTGDMEPPAAPARRWAIGSRWRSSGPPTRRHGPWAGGRHGHHVPGRELLGAALALASRG